MINILVVDDEKEIAHHIASLTQNHVPNCQVDVFTSGTKALRALQQTNYDLVITDIVMPVTDGFAILEYIAVHSPETEVIFLTAYMEFNFIYRANKIKSIRYIVKTEKDKAIVEEILRSAEKICAFEAVPPVSAENSQQKITDTSQTIQSKIEILERLKEYIGTHINEELTVTSLAEQFHYHPSYLSRLFRSHHEETLSDYITHEKMQVAKQMLATSDKLVQDISLELGYQSSQAFSRAFKRESGLTPQEYRRTLIK